MTFSIAGRCAETGMLGAVVATSAVAVGNRCIWAEANVGAVQTQHRTDPRLGPKILEFLKQGLSPAKAISELEQSDPDLKWRQLGVISVSGECAFFNGAKITSIKNTLIGNNCVAAGNVLHNSKVVDQMISTFEQSENEPLAERLLLAIEAGEEAGGELKQLKSAALLIVHRESFALVDLRVDLSSQPLIELRFLWELYQPGVENFVLRAIQPDIAPGYP
ncbi:MAG: DUF1028 domain-containing protein [Rhizomicrobium sp.]